jgi:hypothetical protein
VSLAEELDDAADSDDEPTLDLRPAVSFFAKSDAAELAVETDGLPLDDGTARVSDRVFRIYMRESVERGFERDKSTRQVLPSHLAAIQPKAEHELAPRKPIPTEVTTMKAEKSMQRGRLRAIVTEQFANLKSSLGRAPSAVELFAAVGAEGKSVQNVRNAAARSGLSLFSTRGMTREQVAAEKVEIAAAKPKRATKKKKPAAPVVRDPRKRAVLASLSANAPEPPAVEGAASLAIIALQTERSEVERQLVAIDRVIERLRSA